MQNNNLEMDLKTFLGSIVIKTMVVKLWSVIPIELLKEHILSILSTTLSIYIFPLILCNL